MTRIGYVDSERLVTRVSACINADSRVPTQFDDSLAVEILSVPDRPSRRIDFRLPNPVEIAGYGQGDC